MSRVFVCGVTTAALVGLSGCAYELSGWGAPSGQETVTVPETSDEGETSTEPETTDGGPTRPTTSAGTSTGGESTSSSGTVEPCDNGKLDEGETATDCGGDQCQPCGLGLDCKDNDDCQSGICGGVCLAAGCDNGQIDGKETDEDCGGGCEPCADNAKCERKTDCQSGVCEEGTCQPATCDDGVKNGDEADEDCGTEECGLCANGAACTLNEQCEKGSCKDSICADPQCTDKRKNGTETDVDCGGDGCPPCGVDEICRSANDCESQVCFMTSASAGRCVEPKCDDGVKNGEESYVDCGGSDPLCSRCADDDPCKVASDCASSVCDSEGLVCSAPSCEDDVRNGDEVGIDCGGSGVGCEGCSNGTPCTNHVDCASNSCDETCLAPTCDDGRKNQTESDVDCGGSCGGCGYNDSCVSDSDCLSNDCDTTCRRGVVGADCVDDADCLSGACSGNSCVPGFRGASCVTGADCQSGYCRSNGTCGSGGLGAACKQAADCASNLCGSSCSASRMSVKSDSGNDTAIVKQNMQVQANAADPARTWQDVAFLYFFSIVSPEVHGNFQSRYYNGPNQATRDSRFLALNGQGNDWVMIWRALAGNTTVVPSASLTQIELQLNNSDWTSFNQSNDYSYRSGGYAENSKIVVCQRVDGRWVHTQGTPPPSFSNPCAYVVDTCAETSAACDVLERAD